MPDPGENAMFKSSTRIKLILLAALVLLGAAFYALSRHLTAPSAEVSAEDPVFREAAPVRINEIMASNDVFTADDGGLYDWVELHNISDTTVDLSGWGLSDRADQIKYLFPAGTSVPAGGYTLVYCAKVLGNSELAFFGISAQGGDAVSLYAPDGVLEQSVEVPAMGKGQSYCLFDGGWALSLSPTPGGENIANDPLSPFDPLLEHSRVVISELMSSNKITIRDADGDYSDWIELCNDGDEACDLTGWFLSDKADELRRWTVPSLVLEPGERRVVFCSGKDRTDGELHTNFSLQREGGGVYLTSPLGVRADSLVYDAMESEQAARPTAEGVEYTYAATPGYENTAEGLEAFIAATDNHGELVINEAVAYNTGLIKDTRGRVFDYVELKNLSSHSISLSGYTLTNDPERPDRCVLPNVKIKPNAYYIVFCSSDVGKKDGSHTYAPFGISTAGEYLYLYKNGELCDSVYVHDLNYGGSIGRMTKGSGFYYFEKQTPSKVNGSAGYRLRTGKVTASLEQGIYNDVEDALIVTLEGEGTIHYTLNGAEPTRTSPVYKEPLRLSKTTVVKAFAVQDGRAAGDVSYYSYIINENHSLPVLSLVCNPKTFRSVSGASLRTAEIDAELSLFSENGIEFSRGCGLRQHGNSSRFVHQKKMFVAEFYERFGGDLICDVFGNGYESQYSSLMLRGETLSYMYILRDSVAALVANRVSDNVLALDNRYCVMYINGAYYGLYPLREDYSKQYVATHTGSTAESCIVVRPPVRSTAPGGLFSLIEKTIKLNMSVAENYEWACEHWDMENIADWILLEGYFNNTDVGGNVRYVTGDNTGGRWMLAYYDFDIALTTKNPGFGDTVYGGNQINSLVQSLLASPQFKKLIAERCVVLLENGLADNIALQVIDECVAEIESELPREIKRWKPSTTWETGLRSTRNFFSDARIPAFIDAVSKLIKLSAEEKQAYFGRFLDPGRAETVEAADGAETTPPEELTE